MALSVPNSVGTEMSMEHDLDQPRVAANRNPKHL